MRHKLTGDRNQCPTCNQYFNSTYAFDAHRTGPFGHDGQPAQRRCLGGDEMRATGMSLNAAGFWRTGLMPAPGIAARSARRENPAPQPADAAQGTPASPG
ncbi:hypothetical protein R75461_07767 [Paraburkholderia nemoris]|uniref:hypothetical protein n=1 Tax=Paraburkholderia nemoris TaxID=2793076 RepID=UPI00190DAE13|nr:MULTISPECIES: hypothetical protein [Paraburkholderia]MBK3786534.1 hypothetical protein [Paraburkholderia aspalathi]CAE6857002.1 hypothetical protein R75461_07767 [Paraburkholderia nemoris]